MNVNAIEVCKGAENAFGKHEVEGRLFTFFFFETY